MTAFGFVLILTLLISLVALVLVLRSRPVDTDGQKLDLASLGLELRQGFLEEILGQRLLRVNIEAEARTYLQTQAEERDVRLMVFNPETREWIFDSEDNPPDLEQLRNHEPLLGTSRLPERQIYSGTFTDSKGQSWVYVEDNLVVANRTNERNANNDRRSPYRLVIASPMPEQTTRGVIEENIDNGLFIALIQATLIGLVSALVFSFVFTHWIGRPLRDMAHAAAQVAEGNYKTRAPIRGPDEVQTVALAFNEMTERVDLSQQAQQDFLANVSHDLRTPLTSIQGFAQAIAEGVTDAAETQHAAEIIQTEASRLTRMVNELLDLARIQAGRMDMTRRAVELKQILQTVGHSLQVKAKERRVTLHINLINLPRVAGDGDRLAQVFTNLVDNAIKHTDQGGEVWLEADLDNSSGGVVIRVKDTGEGIPSEDLPRVFERFYQVDKSRTKRAGTGLGLAITYEIVQAHHGRIWVESYVGKGSTFNVWLPQPLYDKQETVLYQRQKSS
jgi:signal transduction histidine kinase